LSWGPVGGVRLEERGSLWSCWGEVDAVVWRRCRDELDIQAADHGQIALDLSDVTFLDTSGLRIVLLAIQTSRRPPRILGVSQWAHDVISLCGILPLLDVSATTRVQMPSDGAERAGER